MWWVDITGRKVFEAPPAAGPARTIDCSQMIAALAPTRSGGLIGALHHGIYLIEPDSGEMRRFAQPPEHDPAHFRFNDAKVDPAGRFWAGTLALDGRPRAACLYRIADDGATTVMERGVSISNGLAWSADGGTLYYIDSPTRCVQAFPYTVADGTLGPGEVVIRFTAGARWMPKDIFGLRTGAGARSRVGMSRGGDSSAASRCPCGT
jgi:sugar lactone lactonase YvrE